MNEHPITARDVGRLEGKVDLVLELIRDRGTRLDGIDLRVRTVEARQSFFAGRQSVFTVAIASVISLVVTATSKLLHW